LTSIYLWVTWKIIPRGLEQFLPEVFPFFILSAIIVMAFGIMIRIITKRVILKNENIQTKELNAAQVDSLYGKFASTKLLDDLEKEQKKEVQDE
jgi:hypothetical protein